MALWSWTDVTKWKHGSTWLQTLYPVGWRGKKRSSRSFLATKKVQGQPILHEILSQKAEEEEEEEPTASAVHFPLYGKSNINWHLFIYYCACVHAHVCAVTLVWRSENNFRELVLAFRHMGTRFYHGTSKSISRIPLWPPLRFLSLGSCHGLLPWFLFMRDHKH